MRRTYCLFAVALTACGPGSAADLSSTEVEGWESFRASVHQEAWEGGKFIVDGDIALADEDALFQYYLDYLDQERAVEGFGVSKKSLLVDRVGGADNIQTWARRYQMTYCVSTSFGTRYDQVVTTMAAAARSWADQVGVDLLHDASQDTNCTASNNNVYFDVNPVTDTYFARAFFPNDGRSARNVLITSSAFTTTSGGRDFEGILRHELGHTLGFRHEHIRLANPCTTEANTNNRALTVYDEQSVMHYPQCRTPAGGGYRQTELDYDGARSLYGTAPALILTSAIL